MAKRKRQPKICYLCGKDVGAKCTRDHVPPLHVFPKSLRKQLNVNLLTLPVHEACNKAYEADEEYFVNALGAVVGDTYSGRALWMDLAEQFKRPEGRSLGLKVRNEFYDIWLPGNMKAKTFEGGRVRRVVAKITRGLFFHEENRFLPIETPCTISILGPHDRAPAEIQDIIGSVANTESKGRHPSIFEYRYLHHKCEDFPDLGSVDCCFWAMRFWSGLLTLTIFHDPECPCRRCKSEKDSSV